MSPANLFSPEPEELQRKMCKRCWTTRLLVHIRWKFLGLELCGCILIPFYWPSVCTIKQAGVSGDILPCAWILLQVNPVHFLTPKVTLDS